MILIQGYFGPIFSASMTQLTQTRLPKPIPLNQTSSYRPLHLPEIGRRLYFSDLINISANLPMPNISEQKYEIFSSFIMHAIAQIAV